MIKKKNEQQQQKKKKHKKKRRRGGGAVRGRSARIRRGRGGLHTRDAASGTYSEAGFGAAGPSTFTGAFSVLAVKVARLGSPSFESGSVWVVTYIKASKRGSDAVLGVLTQWCYATWGVGLGIYTLGAHSSGRMKHPLSNY